MRQQLYGEKPDCSGHKEDVLGEADMKKLATAIGDLSYNAMNVLMGELAHKLTIDAARDLEGGREKLADSLLKASEALSHAQVHVSMAWLISKPHMKKTKQQ